MRPRYEDYGTYFQPSGTVVGVAEDAISEGLSRGLFVSPASVCSCLSAEYGGYSNQAHIRWLEVFQERQDVSCPMDDAINQHGFPADFVENKIIVHDQHSVAHPC